MDEQKRILIVDDDEMIVWIIERALEKQGHRIYTAHDGEDGLHKARKLHPDLVILDIMMPIMDGYEVCEALRADPELADVNVLILTAVVNAPAGKRNGSGGTVRERLQALDVGADAFLSKPIRVRELVARVNDILLTPAGT